MNVKFLNPFVDAANEVLLAEAGLKLDRGPLSLQKSALTTDEVTVLLNLVGQIQGVVLYGLSVATSLAFVSRMISQEFSEFDSLAQSGVAELGNVITGRATIALANTGSVVDISPPTLIQGRGVTISTLDFPRIVVPLTCDVGQLTVHLALRESPPGARVQNYVPLLATVGH